MNINSANEIAVVIDMSRPPPFTLFKKYPMEVFCKHPFYIYHPMKMFVQKLNFRVEGGSRKEEGK
jgi:hypothetical protein